MFRQVLVLLITIIPASMMVHAAQQRMSLEGRGSSDSDFQAGFYRPQSEDAATLWDTWAVFHEGTFYLYYLATSRTALHAGKGWDSIGAATSSDGVRWTEYGRILKAREGVDWMGTGHIWKAVASGQAEKFIMNFSEHDGTRQTIFFAESTDLLNWTRLPNDYEFAQDARWYRENGRWDCIAAMRKPGEGYYGFWTATPKDGPGIGFGESIDGINWKALPPARTVDGGEVGGVEKIGHKYYLMLGQAMVNSMSTLVSNDPAGPFEAPPANRRLAVWPAYFLRYVHGPDGSLLSCHQTKGEAGAGVQMTPLKLVTVDDAGVLRLRWWKGNTVLKDSLLNLPTLGDFIELPNISDGVVIEGTIRLPAVSRAEKDLALLRPASASSTSSKGQEADKCAPEKAFDGQYWTYWQADADESDAWIQVDLGSVKDIGRVRIAWTRPGTPELFDLLVSSDGDEWTKIALGIDPGFRGSVTHLSGLDATGRYVRVHCRKHPAPESPIGYSLMEMNVYGDARVDLDKNVTPGGFLIHLENRKAAAILVDAAGVAEFGHINPDGTDFRMEERIDRALGDSDFKNFRLLLKRSLVELYLDDVWIHGYSLKRRPTGRIDFLALDGWTAVERVKVWAFPRPDR